MHGDCVGVLIQKDNGNLQFRYHETYVATGGIALSQSMPLQRTAFDHRTCMAVFGGLLPEQDVRRAVAQLLGVSPTNDYRLLEELGGDCAGAIELHLDGRTPPRSELVRAVTPEQLDRILVELPRRPLALDDVEPAPRMSLAGAQGKLPVVISASSVGIPEAGGPPTTHILKPEPDRFPGLVDNEHFCMALAREIGLPVAATSTAQTLSGLPYLVVERFDRDPTFEPPRRLHQEDMCQALARTTSEKYQAEGGPSAPEVVSLLRRASAAPARDVPVFWNALVLNVLLGNCDAHGKNYSLLYDTVRPTLAPLYDLVATDRYPELTHRLAMSIDGAKQLEDVTTSAWEQCARDCGLQPRYALSQVEQVADRALSAALHLLDGDEHDNDAARSIVEALRQRAQAYR
jgi:serine/threonine-protein kinase HipA